MCYSDVFNLSQDGYIFVLLLFDGHYYYNYYWLPDGREVKLLGLQSKTSWSLAFYAGCPSCSYAKAANWHKANWTILTFPVLCMRAFGFWLLALALLLSIRVVATTINTKGGLSTSAPPPLSSAKICLIFFLFCLITCNFFFFWLCQFLHINNLGLLEVRLPKTENNKQDKTTKIYVSQYSMSSLNYQISLTFMIMCIITWSFNKSLSIRNTITCCMIKMPSI